MNPVWTSFAFHSYGYFDPLPRFRQGKKGDRHLLGLTRFLTVAKHFGQGICLLRMDWVGWVIRGRAKCPFTAGTHVRTYPTQGYGWPLQQQQQQ